MISTREPQYIDIDTASVSVSILLILKRYGLSWVKRRPRIGSPECPSPAHLGGMMLDDVTAMRRCHWLQYRVEEDCRGMSIHPLSRPLAGGTNITVLGPCDPIYLHLGHVILGPLQLSPWRSLGQFQCSLVSSMNKTELQWADYLVFGLSLVLTAGVGLFLSLYKRKNSSPEELLLASRSMHFLPVCLR
ncbi:hypothetical protein CAPTEDRAFT_202665 [Capitella teleta]|uniref:Uncharacterized protein n=1 Tax=Capitella teleta TaxID=283909 RepID=R7VHI8_CAPTE|nr:hypothetical protein CAPTEDRAFT_202665 [Capitella teleta]|eukprot:ELU15155.1 hypothetical protein CAPTEDRAFT_202665 [Capitella teleta]